ncbi:MAG: hypothetical protein GY765_03685 [bacterium]|nr:hypothetical protein [bacterium]
MTEEDGNDAVVIGKGGYWLLTILFVVMIFLFSLILVVSAINLVTTNQGVKETLLQIPVTLRNDALIKPDGTLSPKAKAYIDQLESKSKETLDSNTISFLFQVFALALVTVGVYLLSRSNENYRNTRNNYQDTIVKYNTVKDGYEHIKGQAGDAIRKAKKIEFFVRCDQFAITLTSYYSNAYLICTLIKEQKNKDLFSDIREQQNQIEKQFKDANEEGLGLELKLLHFFLDYSTKIRNIIKSFTKLGIEIPVDILKICEANQKTLTGSDFDGRYKSQMEELADSDATQSETPIL